MQSLWRSFRGVNRLTNSNIMNLRSPGVYSAIVRPELLAKDFTYEIGTNGSSFQQSAHQKKDDSLELPIEYHSLNFLMWENNFRTRRELIPSRSRKFQSPIVENNSSIRCMTTVVHPDASLGEDSSATLPDMSQPQRIKFKRLDKTARHIMNILDKEAVEKVQVDREFPDIRPGYIIQLKVEVPENKRRVSTIKGIVIARRNAGLHSTFRLRRLVAGVGVESVFPLYSPNIKEMKVLDKKKVRRAKLYYLRDRMNPLKK